MGNLQRRMKSLGTSGMSLAGCLCMPNGHKPNGKTEETLQNSYKETKARLQKIENAGLNIISIRGVSLENCCAKILIMKMNFARTPM